MKNAKDVKAEHNIVAVIQADGITLKKQGRQFVGLCPFHNEGTPSLKVNEGKQIFKCYGCGVGGDVFDYLHHRIGYKINDAIKYLEGQTFAVIDQSNEVFKGAKNAEPWTPYATAPRPASDFTHYRLGTAAKTWTYRTAKGEIIGHTCRFNLPNGGKDVLPMVWASNGTRDAWRWQAFQRPRPLYGLDKLAGRPDAPVIVVEGEKAADFAATLFPNHVVVTWPGGTNALKWIDFTPLHGRRVTLSPDNDEPGFKAMSVIAVMLKGHAAKVNWLPPIKGAEKGWDWADFTGTADDAKAHAKASVCAPLEGMTISKPEPKPAKEPVELPPIKENSPSRMEEHFRILGFEKTEKGSLIYYYYVRSSLKVLSYSATALSVSNLMTLAPLSWWEMEFPSKRGVDINAAQNWLITTGNSRGIFNEESIRGRGAWMDGDTPVIHAGDRLYVNGAEVSLSGFKSDHLYEQMRTLGLRPVEPLSTPEANRVMEFLTQLSFERDLSAYLLAGWCVIAPVCGALTWRPHIWLTGGAGTGKTWTFKYVVRRLLGKFPLAVQSVTTSSFIRQYMQSDALPVVFDEAESNTRNASERITDILELVRSASSEDGGVIGKGSSFGAAKSYQMRSCFAFASIVVGAESQADQSRISVLTFKANTRSDKETWWPAFKQSYFSTITTEWVERLQARTIRLLPVILANTQTFADAAASVLGEQRTGDQLGAMLAGAYSLHSSRAITFDEAVKWMRERDWTEEKALEAQRDEILLLNHMMEHVERISAGGYTTERSIGELITIALKKMTDLSMVPETAESHLRRLGIKTDGEGFVIGQATVWLGNVLKNTPWERSTHRILERLKDAKPKDATHFSPGIKKRGVWIPYELIAGEVPEPAPPLDDLPF